LQLPKPLERIERYREHCGLDIITAVELAAIQLDWDLEDLAVLHFSWQLEVFAAKRMHPPEAV
jgi:hypothetical protein